MSPDDEVKLYFDYKSPYAYLAKDPAFELGREYRVSVRWIPFILRIKGKGERSVYSERKVRYSYMDARRWANRRGGLRSMRIMGPPKIYDSRPALIGALFAMDNELFRPYTDAVFGRFFERTLEIDVESEIAAVIAECGGDAEAYLRFVAGEGAAKLDSCLDEADADGIFGVPQFVFRGELFWGYDRIALLRERLDEAGLGR